MKRIFGSLLDVRRGEILLTVLMFVTYYLLLVTYYLLKPARDSLFLVKVDPLQLPLVFIITAIVTVPVVTLYSRVSRSLKLNHLMSGTCAVLVVNLLILRWLIQWDHAWIYYLFYTWVSIYGALSTSQFWLLGNAVFDASQAKRIFVLLGLGGIIGAFTGGEVTSLCVSRLGISTPDLLYFCMAILLFTVVLTNIIWNMQKPEETGRARPYQKRVEKKENIGRLFREIKRTRFLMLIVAIIALTMMVASFVDYQFKVVSTESFPTTGELTSFLGKFYGRLSLVSLFLQLLFAYRFLRVLGVAGVILFLPLGLLAGSAAMFIYPGLTAAVLLRGADGSLKYSLDKTGRELLFLPVPLDVKKRTKIFIDMFVDRWFRGIAGGLLLLCTLVLHLSIRHISLVVIGLLAVWIALALLIRKEYVNAFRTALEKREIDLDQISVNITDAQTIGVLITSLKSGHERQISYALDMVSSVADRKLIGPVRPLLEHPSAEIRQKAMRVLCAQGDGELVADMQKRLDDPDPEVRITAVSFLCDHGGTGRADALRRFLQHEDVRIQAAAVACIADSGSDAEQDMIDEAAVAGILRYDGPGRESCRIQVARAFGRMRRSGLGEHLKTLMTDSSPAVVRQTIESVGRLRAREHVPWLMEKLGDRRYRVSARNALAAYGAGLLGTMSDYLNDENVPITVRAAVPRVMSQVRNQSAVDLLLENLERVDPRLRYPVIKALSKIRAARPDLRFAKEKIDTALMDETKSYFEAHRILSMCRNSDEPSGRLLTQALIEKQDLNLEQIFRLLGLSYPPNDIYTAYMGVTSNKRLLRASAVEFLENLLKSDVKKFVLPILDDSATESFLRRRLNLFGIRFEGNEAALKHLIGGRDRWLRACAVYHSMHFRDAELDTLVDQAAGDTDPVVRETAGIVMSRRT